MMSRGVVVVHAPSGGTSQMAIPVQGGTITTTTMVAAQTANNWQQEQQLQPQQQFQQQQQFHQQQQMVSALPPKYEQAVAAS